MNEKTNEINDLEMEKVVGGSIDPFQYDAGKKFVCPECGGIVPISLEQLISCDRVFCPGCGLGIYLRK